MLLSTRSAAHPAVSRGVVALQTSADLTTWSPAEELYETFLTHCPECPEIFELDGTWVLGYSRFTDRRGTIYRFAGNPRGPWHHFDTEGPDGINWYAAKSLTDDAGRRIAFGWVPDRNPQPSATTGHWLWAGDLAVPRQLGLNKDRQLAMTIPAEVTRSLGGDLQLLARHGTGTWTQEPDPGASFRVEAGGGFGYCILETDANAANYAVSVTVTGASAAAIVGIAVQTDEQLDRGAAVLCYPREQRLAAVDLTAARSEIANEYEKATTEYAPVAEAFLPAASFDPIVIRVVVRSDVVEAFVADTVCLTYRLSIREAGPIALLIQDGSATFTDIRAQFLDQLG
jgi:beta-fructofuranosidase